SVLRIFMSRTALRSIAAAAPGAAVRAANANRAACRAAISRTIGWAIGVPAAVAVVPDLLQSGDVAGRLRERRRVCRGGQGRGRTEDAEPGGNDSSQDEGTHRSSFRV